MCNSSKVGAIIATKNPLLCVGKWVGMPTGGIDFTPKWVSFGGYYCYRKDVRRYAGLRPYVARDDIICLVECDGEVTIDENMGKYRRLKRLSPDDARKVWSRIAKTEFDEGCSLLDEVNDCIKLGAKPDWL